MSEINIFTIGFTKKSAEVFFTKLKEAGVKRIVDVRLNNSSQLAGFSKKDDLIYFLKELADIDYVHMPELSPTKEILDAFKKKKGDWAAYVNDFIDLLKQRGVEDTVSKDIMDRGCLLCSEDQPDQCHRRLVADYLEKRWGDVQITHII